MSPRSCGPCYACCVHLGIEELQKWPDQSCKYLSGTNGPDKRCSIYASRPVACRHYQCLWLQGAFDPDLQPNKSGIIVSPYTTGADDIPSNVTCCTIHVCDSQKAGRLEDPESLLNRTISQLPPELINDIRIRWTKSTKVIRLFEGFVWMGKLLKGEGYEDLKFEIHEPPVGSFLIRTLCSK